MPLVEKCGYPTSGYQNHEVTGTIGDTDSMPLSDHGTLEESHEDESPEPLFSHLQNKMSIPHWCYKYQCSGHSCCMCFYWECRYISHIPTKFKGVIHSTFSLVWCRFLRASACILLTDAFCRVCPHSVKFSGVHSPEPR